MGFRKGNLLELNIDDTAFGGKGFTRVEGIAVFVEGAIPFDRVLAKITRKKKNYMEARIIELINPSPFRESPACEYSGYCGGCKWQFLNYEKQLAYKKKHVIDSLEHIGLFNNVKVHDTIPSESILGYRNKMEFSCSDRRWLLPEEFENETVDKGFALGLHVPGTFNKIIDIHQCLLQPELGNSILRDIKDYIRNSKENVYGIRSHVGFWRYVVIRNSKAYNEWMVNLVTASENRNEVQHLADMLAKKYPQVVSIMNNITTKKAGIAVGEYEIKLHGRPFINDKIGTYAFDISANSFFQTNTKSAENLFRKTLEYSRLTGNETVFDLYSGTGAISIFLSNSAREVIGMEITKSAIDDAIRNCRKNSVNNCRFLLGDIQKNLLGFGKVPDVLIIDPPRSGMHKEVVRQVVQLGADKIVYVSCNPTTLARDLSAMKDTYDVKEVQPVDMFPHTYHIEAVCRLEKRSKQL